MERTGRLTAALPWAVAGLTYFLSVELGRWLAQPDIGVGTFRPDAGVLVAWLLLVPARRWAVVAGIAATAFVAASLGVHHTPFGPATGRAAVAVAEGLLAAGLVRAILGPLSSRVGLGYLLAVLGLAGLVAPLLGASAETLIFRRDADGLSVWPQEWFARVLGVVVVAPLGLAVVTDGMRIVRRAKPTRWVEAGLMVGTVVGVAGLVFWEQYTSLSFTYLVPLVLVWPALRFGLLGAAVALAIITLVAVRGTLAGYGPMAEAGVPPDQQLLLLQAFLGTHAVTYLLLAVLLADRRDALIALRDANDELEDRVRRRTADLAHANAGLIEKQRLFERITEATPDILYLQDLTTGRNVFTNNQINAVLGYSPEQILTMGESVIAELIVADDLPRVEAKHRDLALAEDGQIFESEFRVRCADGRIRWVQARSVVFTRLPDGSAHLALGLMRDVTESKQAADVLTESERHFRALADTSPGLRWVMTPAGRIESANSRWVDYFGHDIPRPGGQVPTDLVHPDDRTQAAARIAEVLAEGVPFEIELRFRRHDGAYHWFLNRGVPVPGPGGRPDRWYGTSTDIQTRKLAEIALHDSEARYRAVFDQAALGIVLCFTDGRFLSVNPGFLAIVGYDVDDLADRRVDDLIPPADREIVHRALRPVFSGDEPKAVVEHTFARKDGSFVPVRATITLVRESGGAQRHTIAVVEEVSDRKRVEDAIRGAEAHVRAVLDNLFAFVAVLTPEGTVTDLNRAALDASGLRREDAIGQKFWDLSPWTYDAQVRTDVQAACERAAWGEPARYDVRVRLGDGSLIDDRLPHRPYAGRHRPGDPRHPVGRRTLPPGRLWSPTSRRPSNRSTFTASTRRWPSSSGTPTSGSPSGPGRPRRCSAGRPAR